MIVVVDTNVPVVANSRSGQASPDCVLVCLQRLVRITRTGRVALDDQWRIIREYQANLRSSGQPGVGDAFLKWILDNRANPERCELVKITPIDNEKSFQEFPSDPALRHFDRSDRKFVAVALAHSQRPPILQAIDSKWWAFRAPLRRNGVNVEFLCQRDLQRLRTQKGKRRGRHTR
jgi:hypothetical protein